jgi:ABC-type Fe3+-hydroxamate transport system substrate-binding protein
MNTQIDQMGYVVQVPDNPQRIISLVPSQTELLFNLGVESRIVGITKFCVHPKDQVNQITKIGGTKRFLFNHIDRLHPDLIFANKEENYREGIVKLKEKYPVWVSDVKSLADAYSMIFAIAKIVQCQDKAMQLVANIKRSFDQLKINTCIRAAYLIWRKPYIVAANDTFVSSMLTIAGFSNVFADLNRYPEISADQLASANPEVILLSSEPYPFTLQHCQEFQMICPQAKVALVDGQMFSWYGSRLQYVPEYFKKLHHQFEIELNK